MLANWQIAGSRSKWSRPIVVPHFRPFFKDATFFGAKPMDIGRQGRQRSASII